MKRTAALACAGALLGSGFTAVAFTGVVAAPVASARTTRTLSVPASYPTISAAVAAARNGDTVLVSPGTYRDNIMVNGKYIAIKAASSDPSRTLIIGRIARSPVYFTNVPYRPGARASITGFRIAHSSAPNGEGGAITAIRNADPVIQNMLLEGNQTTRGGAILAYGNSNPVIQHNTIRYNDASFCGGGIFAAVGSSPTILYNTINGNRVAGGRLPNGGPAGGALYLSNGPSGTTHPNVQHNIMHGNSASFAGGGVYLSSGTNAHIISNRIEANTSAYGGGIHIENHGAQPTISYNVINGNAAPRNSAYASSGSGGGISVFGGSIPHIGHNSILSNTATYAGGAIVVAEGSHAITDSNKMYGNAVRGGVSGAAGGAMFIAQASASVTNSILFGNKAPNGGGIAALGSGNVSVVNNTIYANTTLTRQSNRAYAGGVFVGAKSANTTLLQNNLILANNGYQVAEQSRVVRFANNDIVDGDLGMYFNYTSHTLHSSSQFNGNGNVAYAAGNISVAPAFVGSSAGDYHLRSGSAGIDDGLRSGAPTVDMDGRRRPTGAAVDIGAYER